MTMMRVGKSTAIDAYSIRSIGVSNGLYRNGLYIGEGEIYPVKIIYIVGTTTKEHEIIFYDKNEAEDYAEQLIDELVRLKSS